MFYKIKIMAAKFKMAAITCFLSHFSNLKFSFILNYTIVQSLMVHFGKQVNSVVQKSMIVIADE